MGGTGAGGSTQRPPMKRQAKPCASYDSWTNSSPKSATSTKNWKVKMALLQIAEPGMSTAPHQHRLAVGIDLGTTNSLVATVRPGLAGVLDDEAGHSLLPSGGRC